MKNLSILIVDDEEILRKQLVESVGLYIDTVYEADNGESAYSVYKEKKPDIILTDINMPKLNGLGFIEKIRESDKKTKIIILSAYTNTEYFQQAVKLYLVSYLIKPIPSGKLKETILQAIYETAEESLIFLSDGYSWNKNQKELYFGTTKIRLSHYEKLFIECLVDSKDKTVPYGVIHYFVYGMQEYSQDAITSLVKRIRKKTSKNIVTSCYKEGYQI